ncbi:MAG: patatin-like phospholipase family protein [Acidimicrobiia bacterium]|nr:patatin-like phospholipase family protein [Acidimicrobiia bacterium]
MSSVGLVLGGGGITGAAYEFAALMAIQMATGWDPNDADIIIGTSAGATVAAVTRADRLHIETLTGGDRSRAEYVSHISQFLLRRARPSGFGRWVRHGILPGLRKPGIDLTLGGPALFDPDGIAEYAEYLAGPLANSWPDRPTLITAYDLEDRRLVVFGTDDAPETTLREAVAASSAVPMVYHPVEIEGRRYVDGGVASGTSAHLVFEHAKQPLDFILIIAPMASDEARENARFYEGMFDRLGAEALSRELEIIEATWPEADVVVLRPDNDVLAVARPNPMSVEMSIPTFLRTLAFLRRELAESHVWELLEEHLR